MSSMNSQPDPHFREGESEADALISAKLRSLRPPADLKARILAVRQNPIAPASLPQSVPVPHFRAPKRGRGRGLWTMTVAALVLGLALLAWIVPLGMRPSFPAYRSDLTDQIVSGEITHLEFTSTQIAPLKEWLAAHHAPADLCIPAGAERLPGVGCRTFLWKGKPVSQVCFSLEDGKIVHLFVIGQGDWHSAPPEGHPEFTHHGEWTMASWREAGATYVLAGVGSEADLQKLFL